MTFVIPLPSLRAILAGLRQRPYHVAVGETGLNLLPAGEAEVLARSFRFVHEGALRSGPVGIAPRVEVGFVPFTLDRPGVWEAVAFAARIEGDLPAAPTCSLMLGSGADIGRFTGIYSIGDQILPVRQIKVVGPGMHRLAAVDFPPLRSRQVSPDEADRWSRLIGALGGQDVWQRLTSLHFCLIGIGRSGSLLAATLVRHGIRNLTMIDPDSLEPHNLDAMDAVAEADVGRKKADAVADHLSPTFQGASIVALPESVFTPTARRVVKAADVLIGCVDEDAARLAIGALACCYVKPLLDIGSGVFFDQGDTPTPLSSRFRSPGMRSRTLGADIRLILPGDGCLLCWGGVASTREAFRRLRTGERPGPPWHEERTGSLRSLNSVAVHQGLRLLEDLVAGRLTGSVWLRYETDERGIPTFQNLPPTRHPNCPLCSLLGTGDLLRR